MAKNMQPILKRCKALGISPSVLGINKETRRNPKQGRRKQSEYAIQLNEKQKAKFIYGVLEKQFRHYYEMASKMEGVTGENLLRLLERRLDNVVYRLGFANKQKRGPPDGLPWPYHRKWQACGYPLLSGIYRRSDLHS